MAKDKKKQKKSDGPLTSEGEHEHDDQDRFRDDVVTNWCGEAFNKRTIQELILKSVKVGKGTCDVVANLRIGATVVRGGEEVFTDLGDFRPTKGYGFIKPYEDKDSNIELSFLLPCDVIALVVDTEKCSESFESKWVQSSCDSYPQSSARFQVGRTVRKTFRKGDHLSLDLSGMLLFLHPHFQSTELDERKEMSKTTRVEDDELVAPREFKGGAGLDAYSLVLPEGSWTADDHAMTVKGFSISAPKQQLFVDADVTIAQGMKYGVLGPNGQGKTTLLRHLQHGALPTPASWDVFLVEQEARATEDSVVDVVLQADQVTRDLLRKEQSLLNELEKMEGVQEEEADLDRLMAVQEELEEVLRELRGRGSEAQEAKVRKILSGLGFPLEQMEWPVSRFSGGWRMRVSIAKALFMQPKLLMLDEPTNHLDLDAVLWLDRYLSEEYPHTVMVVSHDADFLDSVCDYILWVEDKKLNQYKGGYSKAKQMRAQKKLQADRTYDQYQKALKSAKNKEAKKAVIDKYGQLEKPQEYQVKFGLTGQGQDRRMGGLGLSQVNFSYSRQQPWLLKDVEFGMDCASRVALVGANGSGKSTFLKLLVNEIEPCEGDFVRSQGLRIEMFSQHFEETLQLGMTGVEFLKYVDQEMSKLSSNWERTIKSDEKARQVLGRYGLQSTHHTKLIGSMSGGQKARVAFAAMGLRQPHILVLDEPTNHLDIETVEALIDALKGYNGGVVIVSHDARLIEQVECDLWVCFQGQIAKFQEGGGDFEGYRKKVLRDLEQRELEALKKAEEARERKRQRLAVSLGEKKAGDLYAAQEEKPKEVKLFSFKDLKKKKKEKKEVLEGPASPSEDGSAPPPPPKEMEEKEKLLDFDPTLKDEEMERKLAEFLTEGKKGNQNKGKTMKKEEEAEEKASPPPAEEEEDDWFGKGKNKKKGKKGRQVPAVQPDDEQSPRIKQEPSTKQEEKEEEVSPRSRGQGKGNKKKGKAPPPQSPSPPPVEEKQQEEEEEEDDWFGKGKKKKGRERRRRLLKTSLLLKSQAKLQRRSRRRRRRRRRKRRRKNQMKTLSSE